MTPTLKPCPFCGGRARITQVQMMPHVEIMGVGCLQCGVEMKTTRPPITTERWNDEYKRWETISTGLCMKEDAVDRWNRRTENAAD